MRAASLVRVKSNFSDGAGRRETEDEAPIRAVVEREVVTPEPDADTIGQNRARFYSMAIYEAAPILFAAIARTLRLMQWQGRRRFASLTG
jgi:hypothetical protein